MKKIKKIKFSEKSLKHMFIYATILIIFYFCFNIGLFFIGIHNIDLGQNIRWINAEYDLDLHDEMNTGKIVSGRSLYQIGNKQIMKAFWNVILLSFVLGMCFVLFLNPYLEYKDKTCILKNGDKRNIK